MASVEVNPVVSASEWRAYVRGHPEGTYCHLPEWQTVMSESFGHRPYYVLARNASGSLSGILPLFHVKSALTGSRLVSLPFVTACDPIADSPDIVESLVNRAKGLCDELRCRYLEIRASMPLSSGLEVSKYFYTYVLGLSDADRLWLDLDKRVRSSVGKATRRGVSVRLDDSAEGLEAFYEMNLCTKRRLGVPGHPKKFFRAMRERLGADFRLYLAEVDGKPAAGGIMISFNGVVDYCYAASDERYWQYSPNDALVWQAIRDGCSQGYRYFDYGKTASDNLGLAQFKRKWGAEKRQLYYHYHPAVPRLASSNRTGTTYRLVTGVWKRLPLSLVRALSPVAFANLD